jgi:hypothetical protein
MRSARLLVWSLVTAVTAPCFGCERHDPGASNAGPGKPIPVVIAYARATSFEDFGEKILLLADGSAVRLPGRDSSLPVMTLGPDAARFAGATEVARRQGVTAWVSRQDQTAHDGDQWSFFYATGDRCHAFETYPGPSQGSYELALHLHQLFFDSHPDMFLFDDTPPRPEVVVESNDAWARRLGAELRAAEGPAADCLRQFLERSLPRPGGASGVTELLEQVRRVPTP